MHSTELRTFGTSMIASGVLCLLTYHYFETRLGTLGWMLMSLGLVWVTMGWRKGFKGE